MTQHPLQWDRREPPLSVVAVLGLGPVGASLAERLAERAPGNLRVAVHRHALAVFGEQAELPWTDGAIWLGEDDGLMCPTTLSPSLPPPLVASAIRRKQQATGRVICTPQLALVVAGTSALPAPSQLHELARSLAVPQ